MNNKPDIDTTCPYTGHKDPCRKHYINCPKWIQVIGHNPNTGEDMNEWACADTWLPILMIENSQVQRETGAAVESFRNNVDRVFQGIIGRVPGENKPDPKLVESEG